MYFVYSFLFCADLILYGTAIEYTKNWYDMYYKNKILKKRRVYCSIRCELPVKIF